MNYCLVNQHLVFYQACLVYYNFCIVISDLYDCTLFFTWKIIILFIELLFSFTNISLVWSIVFLDFFSSFCLFYCCCYIVWNVSCLFIIVVRNSHLFFLIFFIWYSLLLFVCPLFQKSTMFNWRWFRILAWSLFMETSSWRMYHKLSPIFPKVEIRKCKLCQFNFFIDWNCTCTPLDADPAVQRLNVCLQDWWLWAQFPVVVNVYCWGILY